jgi:hypothetical protein
MVDPCRSLATQPRIHCEPPKGSQHVTMSSLHGGRSSIMAYGRAIEKASPGAPISWEYTAAISGTEASCGCPKNTQPRLNLLPSGPKLHRIYMSLRLAPHLPPVAFGHHGMLKSHAAGLFEEQPREPEHAP